ncbi:hypothetical protein PARPLA_02662 [Rhodobacteraceae bacterium THAF1]|uniref:VOC family protein n=1 Tax=Palleronia sp. THAF1 TaxID=2587842 RepID=UPI000F3E1A30|nr:VOC family protein [Palleronia sp. THAF1]QFU08655.1 hypothetical protein FIU81_08210 [Palleronia sp. THAF1]VDC28401.1 hypothetical protein PARPLA_02662 [Rhodobacteraceae bacterium THAF1]
MATLDHAFVIMPTEASARKALTRDGLRASYRRAHPGQGTRNLCACLDDVFLEYLWFDDSEIGVAARRAGLVGRSCRLGLCWRGAAPTEVFAYQPDYLPQGVTIEIATLSRDPEMPFFFGFKGAVPPILRKDGLPGRRQRPRFARLSSATLFHPQASRLARRVAKVDGLELRRGAPELDMSIVDPGGRMRRRIRWHG